MNEAFKHWYKEFQTHRQFPMSIEDNQKYVASTAFLAGAAAMSNGSFGVCAICPNRKVKK